MKSETEGDLRILRNYIKNCSKEKIRKVVHGEQKLHEKKNQ